MRIQVMRLYDIETDMSPKEFIQMMNTYNMQELGEPLEMPSLREAAIVATYACDGGDLTDTVSDEGSEDLITYTGVDNPNLVLTTEDLIWEG